MELGMNCRLTRTTASPLPFRTRRIVWTWIAMPVLFLAGCSQTGNPRDGAGAVQQRAVSKNLVEVWDSFFLAGTKVGFGRTRMGSRRENGSDVHVFDSEIQMNVRRGGEKTSQTISSEWIEDSSGRLIRFHTKQGPSTTRGIYDGSVIRLQVMTPGRQSDHEIAWQPDWRGFFGVEQSLSERPLEPGQSREFKMLLPVLHVAADVQLNARNQEVVQLLDESATLLRIDSVTRLPDGQTLQSVLWADEKGVVHKTFMPGLNQESYRTTKENALEQEDGQSIDLLNDMVAKVSTRLDDPHSAKRIVYRVHLANKDPAAVFARDSRQQVVEISDRQAELTVLASQLASSPSADQTSSSADTPSDADNGPSGIIQSDAPLVRAMAAEIGPDEGSPVMLATALEAAVNRLITEVDFSQAFATAAEVAETRRGDCTEHSVLLAALCRARGLPARVAIGLVYVDSLHGFAYHMWNEVWIGDRWLSLDATLARGGIGPAHLKLTHSSLDDTAAFGAFLPVLHVMGQLDVEIVEVSDE